MYPTNETVTFSVAMESISKTSYFHDRNGVDIKNEDTPWHTRKILLMECMFI